MDYLLDLIEWLAICAFAITVWSLGILAAWALIDSFVL